MQTRMIMSKTARKKTQTGKERPSWFEEAGLGTTTSDSQPTQSHADPPSQPGAQPRGARPAPRRLAVTNNTGDVPASEVERGGTTTNNHDLKDLWKAHVAPDAHHLFLIVPNNNWRADGTPREKPFPLVARRLGAFFGDQRREIDVLGVHIFGY